MDEQRSSRLKLRGTPRIVILDAALNIVFAQAQAIAYLVTAFSMPPLERLERLPGELEEVVRGVTLGWHNAGEEKKREAIVRVSDRLALRICELDGVGGSYVGVFLEEDARRTDMRAITERYSLTRREAQVLTLILQGMHPGEIARTLCIAETTVADYVKQLLKKIGARNRAEMVAKALDSNTSSR